MAVPFVTQRRGPLRIYPEGPNRPHRLPRQGPRIEADVDTLTGYGVAYFGNDWRAENRTSSHHIAERLSQLVPVVYIESPGQRAPKANARDLRKVWHKVQETVAPPQRLGAQLWHATIPQLPFRRNAAFRAMNFHVAQLLCRRALRHMSAERLISWFVA